MHIIPLNDIKIASTRQRREFDAEASMELVESIIDNGLFHPIVIRVVPQGELETEYHLVAGERRIKAIQDLWQLGGNLVCNDQIIPEGSIPCISLGELSPLEAEEAELEENIRRKDLTWQEKAAATKRLSDLRSAQSRESGKTPPSVAEISREVRGSSEGIHHALTRQELLVAQHLNQPEVAKAKSLKEAFKILKEKDVLRKNTELGKQMGNVSSSSRYRLEQGDCLDLLPKIPSETIDVILSDPPYGMGADTFGDSGGAVRGSHSYQDDFYSWSSLIVTLCPELFRVAKPQAHVYLFCDFENFPILRNTMELAGWTVFRTPLIWHKPANYRAPWPEHGPQRKYECILYAMKGKKNTNKLAPDVLTYPSDDNLGHNAQKPVALLQDLLSRSCSPGDTILDPFCGSGSIFPAAHAMNCYVIGMELDPAFYGMSLRRIQELK